MARSSAVADSACFAMQEIELSHLKNRRGLGPRDESGREPACLEGIRGEG